MTWRNGPASAFALAGGKLRKLMNLEHYPMVAIPITPPPLSISKALAMKNMGLGTSAKDMAS
jgi:hypothetical protein